MDELSQFAPTFLLLFPIQQAQMIYWFIAMT